MSFYLLFNIYAVWKFIWVQTFIVYTFRRNYVEKLGRSRQALVKGVRQYITSTEVSTALRPFYFLVHPDLFGQHPRAQHINDASLKSLNSHLDQLLHNRTPNPVKLQFYIKNKRVEGTILLFHLFKMRKKIIFGKQTNNIYFSYWNLKMHKGEFHN